MIWNLTMMMHGLMILIIVVYVRINFIIPSWILYYLGTSNCLSLEYFDNYFSNLIFVSNYPSFSLGFVLISVVFVNKLNKIVLQTKKIVFHVFVINFYVTRIYFVLQGIRRCILDHATAKKDHWSSGDGED